MDNKLNNVQAVLTRFRDFVISESKKNLNTGGEHGSHNNTSALKNSLKGEIVSEGDFSIVAFKMNDYGYYQDKGVKGKSSSAKAPNSPFRFGSGKSSSNGQGLTKSILKWVQAKRFQFRNKVNGKNTKKGTLMSYQQTAYLISRSIFHKGIKPSLFFTKPFEAGYKKYIDTDLMKAFGQDIDTILDYNLTNIK